jgi:hypothetical protein
MWLQTKPANARPSAPAAPTPPEASKRRDFRTTAKAGKPGEQAAIAFSDRAGQTSPMEKKHAALVYVGPSKKIAGTSSEFLIMTKLIEGFARIAPAGRAQQLQHGVFLCDLDACFPAIMALIQEAQTYAACVLVAEIGEAPVMLSPDYKEAAAFLQKMGRRVQMTGQKEEMIPVAPQAEGQ